jgi:catechol 2,3-dioxygenase-like lactoylglutathione lyase family enzyme
MTPAEPSAGPIGRPGAEAGAPATFGETRVILVPTDHERARRFYRNAVGLEVLGVFPDDSGVLFRLNGGATLELLRDPFGPPSPGARLALEVGSLEECRARLQGAGVACPEPQRQPWGHRTMTVTDPDGNAITFFQPEEAP